MPPQRQSLADVTPLNQSFEPTARLRLAAAQLKRWPASA